MLLVVVKELLFIFILVLSLKVKLELVFRFSVFVCMQRELFSVNCDVSCSEVVLVYILFIEIVLLKVMVLFVLKFSLFSVMLLELFMLVNVIVSMLVLDFDCRVLFIWRLEFKLKFIFLLRVMVIFELIIIWFKILSEVFGVFLFVQIVVFDYVLEEIVVQVVVFV